MRLVRLCLGVMLLVTAASPLMVSMLQASIAPSTAVRSAATKYLETTRKDVKATNVVGGNDIAALGLDQTAELLVGVLSAPGNANRRERMRTTSGRDFAESSNSNKASIRMFFIVGDSHCGFNAEELPDSVDTFPCSNTKLAKELKGDLDESEHLRTSLLQEYREHKDIVFVPSVDTYHSSAEKMKAFYRFMWLARLNFTIFIKSDDDSLFVLPRLMLNYKTVKHAIVQSVPTWWGSFRIVDLPVREVPSTNSEFAYKNFKMTSYQWPAFIYYPLYAIGTAHALNRAFVEWLGKYNKLLKTDPVWMEDVAHGVWFDTMVGHYRARNMSNIPSRLVDYRWSHNVGTYKSCNEDTHLIGSVDAKDMHSLWKEGARVCSSSRHCIWRKNVKHCALCDSQNNRFLPAQVVNFQGIDQHYFGSAAWTGCWPSASIGNSQDFRRQMSRPHVKMNRSATTHCAHRTNSIISEKKMCAPRASDVSWLTKEEILSVVERCATTGHAGLTKENIKTLSDFIDSKNPGMMYFPRRYASQACQVAFDTKTYRRTIISSIARKFADAGNMSSLPIEFFELAAHALSTSDFGLNNRTTVQLHTLQTLYS